MSRASTQQLDKSEFEEVCKNGLHNIAVPLSHCLKIPEGDKGKLGLPPLDKWGKKYYSLIHHTDNRGVLFSPGLEMLFVEKASEK